MVPVEMKNVYASIILSCFFHLNASAQKTIKAKDAYKHIGQKVFVVGQIKAQAGPGYLNSISFYITTDSIRVGLGITVPYEIWSKYKLGEKNLTTNLKGQTMKVYGLIKLYGEPQIEIKKASDLQLIMR
ncbi:hypothetical protein [Mucilaginibacter psychrotolerans]|uniref:Uncharacterized protein n=1 Tax=Mucilaginibacter psychrotolerans TaxID=1524096 RepID=A0A4Y8SJT2_9SPHI|nr:hypothetical protein [Mucilaginibacter psychrotolerans]TFF38921.1 hypothetical protein E2R66_07945 [Mucilaginibacter psychrotolerans]